VSKRVLLTRDGVLGLYHAALVIDQHHGIVSSVMFLHGKRNWAKHLPRGCKVEDVGRAVVMPGLIDMQAHLCEPGLQNWEGCVIDLPSRTFVARAQPAVSMRERRASPSLAITLQSGPPALLRLSRFASGTMAAAAGGVTCLMDMPTRCEPPTVDEHALAQKRAKAEGK
jgi:hypothetical protein